MSNVDMKELEKLMHNYTNNLLDNIDRKRGNADYIFQKEIVKMFYQRVMNHFEGNKTKAANFLGITRATLNKRLKIYNLE